MELTENTMNEDLTEGIELENNIPKSICDEIIRQANGNLHISDVYRVAKWGKIEEKVFLNTYGEIEQGYIEDSETKYPKNEIGTYSTSVYTERKSCDKFIKILKRGVRLRKLYPYPVVLKGKTSNGLVQRTIDRIPDCDPTHIDWWLYYGKKEIVMNDFVLCD